MTFPVVKALQLLPREAMAALWERIKAKPTDPAEVVAVIEVLEACGAVEACVTHAVRLVEESFKRAAPLRPETFAKVMLHAFGAYLVELPK